MAKNTDILSKEAIKSYLNSNFFDIHIVEETGSTNADVRLLAENGAKEGTVVIANSQKEGRGRLGRSFSSPKGTGLYMSLLLRPDFLPDETLFLTCAAGVAVSKTLEYLSGRKNGIKWVNDIYSEDNRKLCGILVEAAFNDDNKSLRYAVLGIGINVYEPDGGFQDEIKDIAGAVFKGGETENAKNKIAAGVLMSFWEMYKELSDRTFFEEYKKRLNVLGKRINVIKGDNVKSAVAVDLTDNCELTVQYDDGKTENLFSGEVSIKKLQ